MAETVATAGARRVARRGTRARLLAVACAAQFVCVLDTSIVNVALPPMQDTLGLSPTGLQWVVSSYTLTFAGFLLLGGRVGDLFGRKRAFVAGLVLFAAGEPRGRAGAGGLAGRRRAVRPGRGRRGAGARPRSAWSPPGSPNRERKAKALSLLTAAAAAGGALGGVIGGLLTGLLSWRWVFFVNVPLGALLLLAAVWALPGRPPGHVRGRLDLPGSIAVTVGTAALVAAVILGEEHGFASARALGCFVLAAASAVLFVVVERRAAEPIVPLDVFRVRPVAVANGLSALVGGALPATMFFLALYLQRVLGMDPLEAGPRAHPGSHRHRARRARGVAAGSPCSGRAAASSWAPCSRPARCSGWRESTSRAATPSTCSCRSRWRSPASAPPGCR